MNLNHHGLTGWSSAIPFPCYFSSKHFQFPNNDRESPWLESRTAQVHDTYHSSKTLGAEGKIDKDSERAADATSSRSLKLKRPAMAAFPSS
jgi:hypothetical protein